MKTRMAAPDARRRELAKIHLLAHELGMDTADVNPDSEYRAILFSIGRVRSAGDLDQAGRLAVLDHLAARKRREGPIPPKGEIAPPECNLPPAAGPDAREKPVVQHALRAMVAKIERQLQAAGKPWAYAHAIGERMFNVKRLEWLPPEQLHKVVAALEIQANREARR